MLLSCIGKELNESKMDIYAHLESHYNFLILNILIFFSASCQFSALWPRKQGFWQVGNCYSHFGCQWDVLRIWKQAQLPILKVIKKQTKTIHLYVKPVDRYPDSRIRFKSQLLHWFQDAIWGKVLNISEPPLCYMVGSKSDYLLGLFKQFESGDGGKALRTMSGTKGDVDIQ